MGRPGVTGPVAQGHLQTARLARPLQTRALLAFLGPEKAIGRKKRGDALRAVLVPEGSGDGARIVSVKHIVNGLGRWYSRRPNRPAVALEK